ncbi:MAG: serine hydrolase domain-containing protein, partial [Acidimicrobiia bacterium]
MNINPKAAGLDATRLDRITDHLDRSYLQPKKIAGCQTLVARHGHVAFFESQGSMDLHLGGGAAEARPVRDDTLWRIYSMSKPITSVALMLLYERALFQLNDPVHKFIPEWRDLKVLEVSDGESRLVEPERPMAVRDLLMHASGLTYGMDPNHPLDQLYMEHGLNGLDMQGRTLEVFVKQLAEMPLKFHPGSRWHYSFSTDVCGRLVEILSGQPFDEFLKTELFAPLKMVDTKFQITEEDLERFPTNYRRRRDKSLRAFDEPSNSRYLRDRAFISGGGGLVSTSSDYFRFCQMLLNGGQVDGERILSRKTIELMTKNHLPGGVDLRRVALGNFGETGFDGIGFGLGFAVTLDETETHEVGSAGHYYWGGAASSIFW